MVSVQFPNAISFLTICPDGDSPYPGPQYRWVEQVRLVNYSTAGLSLKFH